MFRARFGSHGRPGPDGQVEHRKETHRVSHIIHSTLQADQAVSRQDPDDDSTSLDFHAWKPLLMLTKYMLMLPLKGVGSSSATSLRVNRVSVIYLLATGMFAWKLIVVALYSKHFIKTVNDLAGTKDAMKNTVWSFTGLLFYGLAAAIFGFFLFQGSALADLVRDWNRLSKKLAYQGTDRGLFRDGLAIFACVWVSLFVENTLFHLFIMEKSTRFKFGRNAYSSYWEYIERQNGLNGFITDPLKVAPGSLFALFLWFDNKTSTWALNLLDIFLAFVARAVSNRFDLLHNHLASELAKVERISRTRGADAAENDDLKVEWAKFRHAHGLIEELLEKFDSFVSPLHFMSFGGNVFYIAWQFFLIMMRGPEEDILDNMYTYSSFFHLIFRIFLVSRGAWKITECAEKPIKTILSSRMAYDTEALRFLQVLRSKDYAFTAYNFFKLSKPFFVELFGALMTFEVIILQAALEKD